MVKSELKKALQAIGVDPKGSTKKLQTLAQSHSIPIKEKRKLIKEGWMGKLKCSLQILYEHGWVDPKRIHLYTFKGCSKNDGGVDTFSPKKLMERQEDFWNKLTLLQYHAMKLGVTLDCSPKCHPELVGEGIEYLWALAKLKYRFSLLIHKRSKDSFLKLFHSCLNTASMIL